MESAVSGTLSRRDFLRLAALASGGAAAPLLRKLASSTQSAATPGKNVLIVVFDALSARHLSLHGYGRETAPNITRLAQGAVVYHNHYAAGNFTTPGTASLLTGVYPWTHRAFQMHAPVALWLERKNLFQAFPNHHRIAYSHNPLVTRIFDQLGDGLDDYVPIEELLLTDDGLIQKLFRVDDDTSSLAWQRTMKAALNEGSAYSLFLSEIYQLRQRGATAGFEAAFPRGLPLIRGDNYFVLEEAVETLAAELSASPQPFLAYLHFIPPHDPYNTHREFVDTFHNDGFSPPEKPADPLFAAGRKFTPQLLSRLRRYYDEFILYADRELGRLVEKLERGGLLANTWVVVTSDHGELFERGIWEHTTPVLYEPVIRVPLLILEPGRTTRRDVRTPTSAVDVLPTLLHATGGAAAEWCEGTALPPYGGSAESERGVYSVEAKMNAPEAPLHKATIALIKGRHKLTRFFGYDALDGSDRIELYNLEADPEELRDLSSIDVARTRRMSDELSEKIADVNAAHR